MCFGDAIFSDVSASEEVDDVLRIFMSRMSTLKYSFLPPMSLETGWVALLSRFRECDCLLMSFLPADSIFVSFGTTEFPAFVALTQNQSESMNFHTRKHSQKESDTAEQQSQLLRFNCQQGLPVQHHK